MRIRSPIYSLLHQEIKACANHLLEISQKLDFSLKEDTTHVLGRLFELHQFACQAQEHEYYLPLYELKEYLYTVMIPFQDDKHCLHSIRFSEALSLLRTPLEIEFDPAIIRSLLNHFIGHFLQETKPGRPLFRKLTEVSLLH